MTPNKPIAEIAVMTVIPGVVVVGGTVVGGEVGGVVAFVVVGVATGCWTWMVKSETG